MAVTMQQIAERAGVSRGTVDRALNNRGSVNPAVAKRIRELAQEMGYKPNISGRALAYAGKKLKIGVIMQYAETPFLHNIETGVREAKTYIEELGCTLIVKKIEKVDVSLMIRYMREMEADEVKAIAITAADDERLRQEISRLRKADIRVVTFNTDIPDAERSCFIGQDSYRSGKVAAGLMGDILGNRGKVAVISGQKTVPSHENRLQGFQDVISADFNKVDIVSVSYTEDDEELMKQIVQNILEEFPDLDGIYCTSAQVDALIRELIAAHRENDIRVIVHDMCGWDLDYLKNFYVDYCIDDDANYQGSEPVMVMFYDLYYGRKPSSEYLYTEIFIRTPYSV